MLSLNKIKLIKSLSLKKNRLKHRLFVAEGHKCVLDLMSSFQCKYMFYTNEFVAKVNADESTLISYEELKKISFLETPQDVLAVFCIPDVAFDSKILDNHELILALDNIQDAGNLGTIIRIADWFGIKKILCSASTVDCYNSKVVQASMGALSRVSLYYVDLLNALQNSGMPIYVSSLDADSLYDTELSAKGIIVMGNEGRGVSEPILNIATNKIFIPNFPQGSITSESLNVGVATAVICAEFRRRLI